MNDPEQQSTYAAEDTLATWLDAASPETGEVAVTITKAGRPQTVTFCPEPEPKFSRPSEVVRFVDRVMQRLRERARAFDSPYRGREQRAVAVHAHSDWKKASYRADVIRLPERRRGGKWALRGIVVLHELAHHLNTGVNGTIIDAHGEGFRTTFVQLLEDVGWTEIAAMLREAYRQAGLDRRDTADDGMLVKVGKLLEHAERGSTQEEREAFFAKAQELATAHSIELAVARAAQTTKEAAQAPTFETLQLGHRGQHSNVRLIALMIRVANANDLRCSIRGDNTGVTLYGFPSDIEIAKTLYMTLAVQMVADADAYIRSGAHKPVHGRTARAAFYAGWADRIGQRLLEAQRATQVKTGMVTVNESAAGADESKSLVLVAKDVELNDYYEQMKQEHGISGTWRGGSRIDDHHSHRRGRSAADRARLGQEKELAT